MEQAGIIVTVVGDGLQAVEAVAQHDYEAVLMDVQMPVVDGYRATMEIRKDAAKRDLPIVAMTASVMAADRDQAFKAGMNDFISKPIDPELLFSVLSKWIKPTMRQEAPLENGRLGGVTTKIPPNPPFPKEIAGVDIQAGLGRVGGNIRLYRKILVNFRDSYSQAPREMAGLLDAGRESEALRLAHSIKGVAGNVGAEKLQTAAAGLEAAIRENPADIPAGSLKVFQEALTELVAALSVLGGQGPIPGPRFIFQWGLFYSGFPKSAG